MLSYVSVIFSSYPDQLSSLQNFSMAGIAFNLIVIRVGRMRADEAARRVVERSLKIETTPRILLIAPSPHRDPGRNREVWVHYHAEKRLDGWVFA